MELNKAIEILTIFVPAPDWITDPDLQDAVKLGIEALKAVQLCRKGVSAQVYLLLPGETERREYERE